MWSRTYLDYILIPTGEYNFFIHSSNNHDYEYMCQDINDYIHSEDYTKLKYYPQLSINQKHIVASDRRQNIIKLTTFLVHVQTWES